MYTILILIYKAFVDHSAPVRVLVELLNKKSISANTRSANDDFLLVISPISRNCSNTFLNDPLNPISVFIFK